MALQPVSYNYLAGATPFADESNSDVPATALSPKMSSRTSPRWSATTSLEIVDGGEQRTFTTLAPGHLVYILTNAVKELAAENDALSARIAALEGTA